MPAISTHPTTSSVVGDFSLLYPLRLEDENEVEEEDDEEGRSQGSVSRGRKDTLLVICRIMAWISLVISFSDFSGAVPLRDSPKHRHIAETNHPPTQQATVRTSRAGTLIHYCQQSTHLQGQDRGRASSTPPPSPLLQPENKEKTHTPQHRLLLTSPYTIHTD